VKKIVLLFFVSLFFLLVMLPLTRESTSFFETIVCVDPSTNDVSVGNAFVISVSLADYIWLQNFEFYLGYNTTILDGLNVLVPPPYEAPVGPQINDTEGYVHVIAVHEGPIPSSASESESFPLASITFKATAVGSSILDLYDTLLFGGLGTDINHTTVDGSVTVSSGIITVPDDYPTIQGAINAANPGDTICVYNGTYYENVVVNKTVSLIGQQPRLTIIIGDGTGAVVYVKANNAVISGFTIYGPTSTYADSGIYVCNSSGNEMSYNIIMNNHFGIYFYYSSNNVIHHNNFFHNVVQTHLEHSSNTWDEGYPSGGNYWIDHTGVDLCSGPYQNETGSDGISDTPYPIGADNEDRYPLMGLVNLFNVETGTWKEVPGWVIASNSDVSDFYFNPGEGAFVSFNVTGQEGTLGYCRVTIPNELLWCDNPEQWQVWVNNTLIEDKKIMEDTNYTYICFTYNHSI
jgi:parallel beta-helix repeat protein